MSQIFQLDPADLALLLAMAPGERIGAISRLNRLAATPSASMQWRSWRSWRRATSGEACAEAWPRRTRPIHRGLIPIRPVRRTNGPWPSVDSRPKPATIAMASTNSTGLARWAGGACALVMAVMLVNSCKHEPVLGPLAVDNGGGGDVEEEGVVCDTNIIWFQQQVLPLLASSCTNPGEGLNCHHTANDDNDEIQITSYETLMASDIVLNGDLMEALTEDDPDKIMPRPPFSPLTPEQIALIQQWINQGAQNNSCEPSACDTLNVTYSGHIVPVLQARCTSCHSGSTPSGGLDLMQWSVANTAATNGTLEGAVRHLGDPYINMPPSGPRLSDCRIRQIQLWIAQGAPNN